MRFPEITGRPIEVVWLPALRAHRGKPVSKGARGAEIHAAGFIRRRRIVFDTALRRKPGLRRRIWTHELFHFVWVRLDNQRRRSFEDVLLRELRRHACGELGWSAEWRKDALRPADRRNRTRRWREYVCESFCDTAAWLFSGVRASGEYTLGRRARNNRRQWFVESGLTRRISV